MIHRRLLRTNVYRLHETAFLIETAVFAGFVGLVRQEVEHFSVGPDYRQVVWDAQGKTISVLPALPDGLSLQDFDLIEPQPRTISVVHYIYDIGGGNYHIETANGQLPPNKPNYPRGTFVAQVAGEITFTEQYFPPI